MFSLMIHSDKATIAEKKTFSTTWNLSYDFFLQCHHFHIPHESLKKAFNCLNNINGSNNGITDFILRRILYKYRLTVKNYIYYPEPQTQEFAFKITS